jgi:glutaredoxin-like protein
MGFLPEEETQALREHLEEHLSAPVALDLFIKPTSRLWIPGARSCDTCDDTRALLQEVAALSDRMTLRVHDVAEDAVATEAKGVDAEHLPVLVLLGAAQGRVRFLGMPTGLELGTLLSAILAVASGESGLSPATRTGLRDLGNDAHIRVFVTPTCPYCPRAARAAVQMAVASARVTVDVIAANEFPDLVDRYGVRGVPKTVINDTVEFVGAEPETDLLRHVLSAVRPADGADQALRAAR